MKLTKEGRDAYKARLTAAILDAMRRDQDMLLEAIQEGRTGLDEMADEDLVTFGQDCYGASPLPEELARVRTSAPVLLCRGVVVRYEGEPWAIGHRGYRRIQYLRRRNARSCPGCANCQPLQDWLAGNAHLLRLPESLTTGAYYRVVWADQRKHFMSLQPIRQLGRGKIHKETK